MKIIIDIPIDAHYHATKRNTSNNDIEIILEAVRKGKPLPYDGYIEDLENFLDGYYKSETDKYVDVRDIAEGDKS